MYLRVVLLIQHATRTCHIVSVIRVIFIRFLAVMNQRFNLLRLYSVVRKLI